MKLHANTRNHRRPKSTAWSKLIARFQPDHRLSAQVTGEDDWEVDVPQVRMSRAFAVMLGLHIVAIGGLFAFHVWGKDEAVREPISSLDPSPVAPVAEVIPEPNTTSDPIPANYAWRNGDTRQLVAARYNISVLNLEEANPGKSFAPGVILTIPPPPRVIAAGAPDPLL